MENVKLIKINKRVLFEGMGGLYFVRKKSMSGVYLQKNGSYNLKEVKLVLVITLKGCSFY